MEVTIKLTEEQLAVLKGEYIGSVDFRYAVQTVVQELVDGEIKVIMGHQRADAVWNLQHGAV